MGIGVAKELIQLVKSYFVGELALFVNETVGIRYFKVRVNIVKGVLGFDEKLALFITLLLLGIDLLVSSIQIEFIQ